MAKSVYFSKEMLEWVEHEAEKKRGSFSYVIQQLILREIQKKKIEDIEGVS